MRTKACAVQLFLNGDYETDQVSFYQALAASARCVIVADGAFDHLQSFGIRPDWIVGDLDSLQRPERIKEVRFLRYPTGKSATDGALALQLAQKLGARDIRITGSLSGRGIPDHMLGNLFLSFPYAANTVTYVEPTFVAYPMQDGQMTIEGSPGDLVSVVPLSVVRLTYAGLRYPLNRQLIPFGDTRPLRNVLVAQRARIAVTGRALIIHERITQR